MSVLLRIWVRWRSDASFSAASNRPDSCTSSLLYAVGGDAFARAKVWHAPPRRQEGVRTRGADGSAMAGCFWGRPGPSNVPSPGALSGPVDLRHHQVRPLSAGVETGLPLR